MSNISDKAQVLLDTIREHKQKALTHVTLANETTDELEKVKRDIQETINKLKEMVAYHIGFASMDESSAEHFGLDMRFGQFDDLITEIFRPKLDEAVNEMIARLEKVLEDIECGHKTPDDSISDAYSPITTPF